MRIEPATAMDVSALANAWVSLAAEQRAHGSRLLASENRSRVRESMAHHVVEDTCLVARLEDGDGIDESDEIDEGDEIDESENRDPVHEASDVDDGGDAGDGDVDEGGSPRFVGFVTFAVDAGGYDLDVVRGTVENIYVDPEYRGRGVGADLLSAAEAELAERGVDAVTLEVLASNHRAREFYDREGYDEHRVVLEKRVDVETDTKGNRGK